VDRQALQAELRQVFDARTTRTLLSVLDRVAAQMRQTGVTREDFGELEQIVAELAEAQQRTEQRVAELVEAQQRTEQRVAELAEAQQRTEQRVAELAEAQQRTEQRVAELAEAQRRTEERLAGVEERQAKAEEHLDRLETNIVLLTEQVRALVASQQKIVDELGGLKGHVLELTYRDKAVSYFGRLLRRPKVIDLNTLWEALETRLPLEAFNDLLLVDLVVQGRPRQRADLGDVWLAVEIAAVVDEEDVTRALRRAESLRQAGYPAVPVVAGERTTLAADDEARQHKVVVLQDGKSFLWDEAVAAWVT
jgi:hypothetical protein